MSKRKLILTTTALLACVALAGCSAGGNAPEPSKAAESTPAAAQPTPGKGNIASDGTDFTTITPEDLKLTTDKEYEFITGYNTTGTLEFVPSTDPRVKDIESYLQEATGYHREYLIAEVDNRKGTDVANMFAVTTYDADGMSYEFKKAYDLIEDARPVWNIDDTYTTALGDKELTEKEYKELDSRGSELAEAQTWAIDPLEKNTFILAMEIDKGAFPKEITGVSVMAHGMFDEVPAHNRLVSEYREWKAFQEEGKEWEAYDPTTAEPMESE